MWKHLPAEVRALLGNYSQLTQPVSDELSGILGLWHNGVVLVANESSAGGKFGVLGDDGVVAVPGCAPSVGAEAAVSGREGEEADVADVAELQQYFGASFEQLGQNMECKQGYNGPAKWIPGSFNTDVHVTACVPACLRAPVHVFPKM